MKKNYPIRYAVMPIIAQSGWSQGLNELERAYKTIVFIASKCFLIGETKEYKENGEESINYQVVFVYQSTEYGWIRVDPEFSCTTGKCINSCNVSSLYKTFEEAQQIAKNENDKIVKKDISLLRYDSDFKKRVEEVKEDMQLKEEHYNKLASKIESATTDLNIDAQKKEQKIIVRYNGKIKLLDISLYDFIRTWCDEEYKVYHLEQTEFDSLKEQVRQAENINLSDYEKLPLILGDPKSKRAQVLDSVNPNVSTFYVEDNYMHYDEKAKSLPETPFSDSDSITKAYTIETYEDIIDSYITSFTFESSENEILIGNKIFTKKINF